MEEALALVFWQSVGEVFQLLLEALDVFFRRFSRQLSQPVKRLHAAELALGGEDFVDDVLVLVDADDGNPLIFSGNRTACRIVCGQ